MSEEVEGIMKGLEITGPRTQSGTRRMGLVAGRKSCGFAPPEMPGLACILAIICYALVAIQTCRVQCSQSTSIQEKAKHSRLGG